MAKTFKVESVLSLVDKFTPALRGVSPKIDKFAAGAKAAFRSIMPEADRLADIVKGVTFGSLAAKGLGAAANLIRSNIGAAIEYRSTLIETQNVVNTVFASQSKYIDAWAVNSAKKFGLTELNAKKFAGTFGSLLGGAGITGEARAGMSMKLTQLAGDIASFYNLNREDAFNKLMSGMRGQSEPLSAIGVNMSVKNMEAFAKTKGIKAAWKDMDQIYQTILRVQYLVENPAIANAVGDYGKDTASWAVSSQDAADALAKMRGKLAEGLMPTLIQAADRVKDLADRIGGWAVKNKAQIEKFFEGAFRGATTLFKFLKDFGPAILAGAGAFKTFNTVISTIDNVKSAVKGVNDALSLMTSAAKLAGTPWADTMSKIAGSAGGAAGAFTNLTAAIGASQLAMAGLLGLAVGGAVLVWQVAKKNTQRLAYEACVDTGTDGMAQNRAMAMVENSQMARADIEIEKKILEEKLWAAGEEESREIMEKMKDLDRKLFATPQVKYEYALERILENERRKANPVKDEMEELLDKADDLINATYETTDAVNGLKGGGRAKGLSYSQMGISEIWDIVRAGV